VLRKLIAIGLSAAVQAAAIGAPLVHIHTGGHESAHHHGRQAVHAHLAGHSSSHQHRPTGRSVDDNDAERTVYLQLFTAVSVSSSSLPPAVVSSFHLNIPAPAAPRHVFQTVHGHDPPSARSRSPRAPPVFLS
jgi:hypothetical protein